MTLTSWFPWHPGPSLPKAWLGSSSNLVRQCRSLIKHSFLSNLIQMSLMSVHTRSPTNEPQNQGPRRGRLAGGHLEPQGPWTPPRLGATSTAAPFLTEGLTEGKGGGGSRAPLPCQPCSCWGFHRVCWGHGPAPRALRSPHLTTIIFPFSLPSGWVSQCYLLSHWVPDATPSAARSVTGTAFLPPRSLSSVTAR